jgi:DNA-binding CsgD family transcriptional regulator
VADLLGLTENTAMKYRSNIRKKVGDNPFSSFWE